MHFLFRKIEKGNGDDKQSEGHDDEGEGGWKAGDVICLYITLSHEDEDVELPYPGLPYTVPQPNLQQDTQDSK